MRRIFVGDVQGCREELELLLERVKFDPASDRLFSVGDAINRGPDSAGCVRLFKKLGAAMVLGNHELHWFEVTAGRRKAGKRDTLENLAAAPDRAELDAWLRARPLLLCEPDVVVVHAGLHPKWGDLEAKARETRATFVDALAHDRPLAREPDLEFATSARYCDPDGRQPDDDWPPPPPPYVPWDELYRGPRTAVFGHWARRGLVVTKHARGLDTGCVYGRALSAWIPEEDRIVQVPARRAWCPLT
ncbi:MAG TPA: metallophosphoesterase [Planctomycetota bacterium]|nr:metallophosphoesterase [Planctomycetota bacterium]